MAGIFRQSLNSSDDFEMHYKGKRNFDVRLQDIAPFAGPFIYLRRNLESTRGTGGPKPYNKFVRTGDYLTILDMATGVAALAGIGMGFYSMFF